MSESNGKKVQALVLQLTYNPDPPAGEMAWGWVANRVPTNVQELKEMVALLTVVQQSFAADLSIAIRKLTPKTAATPAEKPESPLVVAGA